MGSRSLFFRFAGRVVRFLTAEDVELSFTDERDSACFSRHGERSKQTSFGCLEAWLCKISMRGLQLTDYSSGKSKDQLSIAGGFWVTQVICTKSGRRSSAITFFRIRSDKAMTLSSADLDHKDYLLSY